MEEYELGEPPPQAKLRQLVEQLGLQDAPSVRLQLLHVGCPQDVASGHGGAGASVANWPTSERYGFVAADIAAYDVEGGGVALDLPAHDPRMAHLLSLDAKALDVAGVGADWERISFFVHCYNFHYSEGFARCVVTKQGEVAPSASAPEDIELESGDSLYRQTARLPLAVMPAVSVPIWVFAQESTPYEHADYLEALEEENDELEQLEPEEHSGYIEAESPLAALNQLMGKKRQLSAVQFEALEQPRSLLGSHPYVGGLPLYLQSHNHDDEPELLLELANEFYLQLGEEVCDCNFGDGGVAYLRQSSSEWECG